MTSENQQRVPILVNTPGRNHFPAFAEKLETVCPNYLFRAGLLAHANRERSENAANEPGYQGRH
jgi:hypothetical protein